MAKVSPNVDRARRLLVAGAVGAHLVLIVVVVIFGLSRGVSGAVSAAVAGIVTIAFFTIGQAVQVMVADAPAKKVMFASLASYGGRVTGLGLLLMLALDNAQRVEFIDPIAVFVATIAAVFGWLGAEFRAYAGMRIPIYDEPEPGE